MATLQFVWFVTSTMLEKLPDSLPANDDIFSIEDDVSKVTFYTNEMRILGVDLDATNLDDDNSFLKMILILLFMSDFWLDAINSKNIEHLKKDR